MQIYTKYRRQEGIGKVAYITAAKTVNENKMMISTRIGNRLKPVKL